MGMTVPVAQEQVGIQAPGIPTERIQPITPAASGANIGEAVAGLGQTIENVGVEARQAWEVGARMTAESNAFTKIAELSAKSDAILYNPDKDPQTGKPIGILNRSGADAIGAPAEYKAKMQAAYDETTKGMSPFEQQIFMHYGRGTMSNGLSQTSAHEAQEVKRYHEQATAGLVDSLKQEMYGVDDPAVFVKKLTDASSAVRESAALDGVHGDTPEGKAILDEKERQTHDYMVGDVIHTQMRNLQDPADNLVAAKPLLSPDVYANLKDAVQAFRVEQQGNAIFAAHSSDPKFIQSDGTLDRSAFSGPIADYVKHAEDIEGGEFAPGDAKKDAIIRQGMAQDLQKSIESQAQAQDKKVAEVSNKSFLNLTDEATQYRNSGKTLADAKKDLTDKYSGLNLGFKTIPMSPSMVDAQVKQIENVYNEPALADARWAAHLPPEVQKALALADSTIDGTFAKHGILKTDSGTQFKPGELAKKQLLDAVKAKKINTPEEIAKYTQDMTAKHSDHWYSRAKFGIEGEASKQEMEPLQALAVKTLTAKGIPTSDKNVAAFMAKNPDWLRANLGK